MTEAEMSYPFTRPVSLAPRHRTSLHAPSGLMI